MGVQKKRWLSFSDVRIRFFDVFAVGVSCACVVWSLFHAYVDRTGEPWIHVESASGEWILPENDFQILEVEGPLGTTTVAVEEDGVRVVSSPCSEKICVQTGRISKPGEWIACLPNRVFITIRTKDSGDIDAVSY